MPVYPLLAGVLLSLVSSLAGAELGQLRLSEILGREVHEPAGRVLGPIRDLLVDPGSHRVEQVELQDGRRFPIEALSSGERDRVLLEPPAEAAAGGGAAPSERPLIRTSELMSRATGIRDLVFDPVEGVLRAAILHSGETVPIEAAWPSR